MKIVSISDVHIKEQGDEASQLFEKFLTHEKVVNSEEIFLLGDIFDLMVGNKDEYIEKYRETFTLLEKLLISGKNIFYFEGNHDFHVKNLFENWSKNIETKGEFRFHKKGLIREYSGKKVHFSHGDDIELGNYSYKIYKYLINNYPLELLADFVVPYSLIERIGISASAKSRARNKDRYSDKKEMGSFVFEKFRESAKRAAALKNVELVVCGHSHVKDMFEGDNFKYVNSGFTPIEKSFISFDEEMNPRFESII
ncbi:MAG: UDP-2,3-diacylglucosamine diphosphatase [Bacteriovoracaceae bacterium]|nr:UDP-2,3-diacylglucosamine diphosphatase [Bacteriovoracaceae bacterium]